MFLRPMATEASAGYVGLGRDAAGLCSPRPCVSIMTMKAKDTRASNVVDEVSIDRSPTKPTWDVLQLRDLFNRGHHNIYKCSCREKNFEESTRRISSVHKNAVHRNGTCPLQSKKCKGRENPLFVSSVKKRLGRCSKGK